MADINGFYGAFTFQATIYCIVGVTADMKIAGNLFYFELTFKMTTLPFLNSTFRIYVLLLFIWLSKKLISLIIIHIIFLAVQSVFSDRSNVWIVS